MALKKVKTPTEFVSWLWQKKYLHKNITVSQIQKLASDNGYTFSKQAIRLALERAEFVTRSGKLSNRVPLYRQVYPYTSRSGGKKSSTIDLFTSLNIHPSIKQVSFKLFKNEHYQEAVFAAFKKINNMVKKKSGLSTKDGKKLMLDTFTPNSPVLKINKLKNSSDTDEQEGFMHIFAGSVQGIRNPRGHDDIKDNPMSAIEYLCLASLLAKKIDKSRKK